MKKRIILTLAAILAMAANPSAADTPAATAAVGENKPATAPANSAAQEKTAADTSAASENKTAAATGDSKTAANPLADLEYSDSKECHLKMPDSGKPLPVIHALLASRGMNSNNQAQLLIALGTAIANGCDINEPDAAGLQPLNAAILFNDAEAVQMLLEKGADPYSPIHKADSPIDGMNSFQFLEKIREKEKARKNGSPRDYSAVAAALQQYR